MTTNFQPTEKAIETAISNGENQQGKYRTLSPVETAALPPPFSPAVLASSI